MTMTDMPIIQFILLLHDIQRGPECACVPLATMLGLEAHKSAPLA